MRTQLSICAFLPDFVAQPLIRFLSGDRYALVQFSSKQEFIDFVGQKKQQIDCLIVQEHSELKQLIDQLCSQAALLPVVVLQLDAEATPSQDFLQTETSIVASQTTTTTLEHSGNQQQDIPFPYAKTAVQLSTAQLNQIGHSIEQAITRFLELSPDPAFNNEVAVVDPSTEFTAQNLLVRQQRRLAEKLKERLGYLSVYYKRDPQNFLRHLPPVEQQKFLETLKSDYREIVLSYFSKETNTLNQRIDEFVNTAFFTDIPVAQIVEIHMELMDEFSKQLQLEGRSEEVLLDYRLTLIDTIAHLCEMYRRSIPRES